MTSNNKGVVIDRENAEYTFSIYFQNGQYAVIAINKTTKNRSYKYFKLLENLQTFLAKKNLNQPVSVQALQSLNPFHSL